MTDKKKEKHTKWIACQIEEDYFGSDAKLHRQERQKKVDSDRSKFKKTDIKKHEKNIREDRRKKAISKTVVTGRVLSITSQGAVVESKGEIFICQIRGLLKREKTKRKNLLVVGDFVQFEKTPDFEGSITHVEKRKSYLSRADNLSRQKEQILAANIDQVLITVSVISPMLKSSIIDRYIIAASTGNLKPVIVINKIDLLDDPQIDPTIRKEQKNLLKMCQEAYKKANIPIIKLSAKTEKGLNKLITTMKNKSSVFSGQSGTGKSSLINSCFNLDLKVKATVKKTRKGSHTTTKSHLVPLQCGGWCIDTPGIKSFGLWDIDEKLLLSYFTEIDKFSHDCKFLNCTHSHEKICAVKVAVEKGKISTLRYDSYISLLETIKKKHFRR